MKTENEKIFFVFYIVKAATMKQNAFIAKELYKVGSLMTIRGKNMQPGTHDVAF